MSFPSPFDAGEVHPAARAAAEALQAELRAGLIPRALLTGPEGGKMFGVLVAEDGTTLRAFSGVLGGKWLVNRFVPPLFDQTARERVEVPGERKVKELSARHAALEHAPELFQLREQTAALAAKHAAALQLLDEAHRVSKEGRAERREANPEQTEALAQESRRDKSARRWLVADQDKELAIPAAALRKLERRLRASDRLRAHVSRRLMQQLHDTYLVPNFRGESKPLRVLSRGEPPSGAGDCAAPKLLAEAVRRGLRPVAMAEFWWGASPPASARTEGEFAPACRHKCGWLLPFMLEGLDVAAPRGLGAEAARSTPLKVLYRDAHLLAVEKPQGLLSVPGKGTALVDSVQSRLRAEFPNALLVHRLDLDTSGVVLVALDEDTYRKLQGQFAARTVDKRYVAWLSGAVTADAGRIELPLRVDLEDRPRQIHDPVHGRHAVTAFRVLERQPARTRVELRPLTGRTHQLRVHASHPLGLGAPIEGDRLYGARGPRLMLHAEQISFQHPATGTPTTVRAPAEF